MCRNSRIIYEMVTGMSYGEAAPIFTLTPLAPYPAIVISGLIFTDHDNAELQTVGHLVTGLGCGY